MPPRLSIVAAVSNNGVIGQQGKLPWHLPGDLARFKELTLKHKVIMGRKTYESLPDKFRPLPGRMNMVISRNKSLSFPGALKFGDFEQAIAHVRDNEEAFVIGGEEVFKLALPKAKLVYLTRVQVECSGDAHFPVGQDLEKEGFCLIQSSALLKLEEDQYPYRFQVWHRPQELPT